MLVKDVMHKGIHMVSRDNSVDQVARIMTGLNIGAVLVGEQGKIEGIFSERDLMIKVVVPGLSVDNTLIWEVMTNKVLTVEENDPVEKVLTKMDKERIRHLPVVRKDGICVGMLGARDLIGAMLTKLESENKIMVEYLLALSRVAIAITDLGREKGVQEGNNIIIRHKLSKANFEDITDTSGDTLNKVLANFQDEQLIIVEKNKIVILDKKKLENKII